MRAISGFPVVMLLKITKQVSAQLTKQNKGTHAIPNDDSMP